MVVTTNADILLKQLTYVYYVNNKPKNANNVALLSEKITQHSSNIDRSLISYKMANRYINSCRKKNGDIKIKNNYYRQ